MTKLGRREFLARAGATALGPMAGSGVAGAQTDDGGDGGGDGGFDPARRVRLPQLGGAALGGYLVHRYGD